jgi:hypothetical protein
MTKRDLIRTLMICAAPGILAALARACGLPMAVFFS